MKNSRMERINSEIKKELSPIIDNTISFIAPNTIISVTEVKTTQDLAVSDVYISIYPDENKDEVLQKIKNRSPQIRHELAGKILLRIMPKLHFRLDTSSQYSDKIENILKNIKYTTDEEK